MSLKERVFATVLLGGLLALPAEAAVFTTLVKLNNQECGYESNDTGNVSQCSGFIESPVLLDSGGTFYQGTARADPGSIGVSTSVLATTDTVDSIDTTASMFDTLTFGIEAGLFALAVDVAGTQSWSLPPAFGGNTVAGTFVDAFVVGGGEVKRAYSSEIFVYPSGGISSQTTVGTLGRSVLTFAFNDFKLDISAVMTSYSQCRSGISGGSCSAGSSFLSSLRFVGGEVFDPEGNAIDTTVSSLSGFDYLKGMEPHDPPPVIPLPASAFLLAGGLAMLSLQRRRRSNRSDLTA